MIGKISSWCGVAGEKSQVGEAEKPVLPSFAASEQYVKDSRCPKWQREG